MFNTKRLTMGAFFIAMGIFLPMIFHALSLGKVFLPMHIPVLLAGFLCGPIIGAIVGALTPILSALLTGMPPLMPPMAQMMIFELGVYGALTGLFYETLRWKVVPSLLLSMVGGRIIYGLLGYTLLPLIGLNKISILYPLTAGLLTSLPGVIIQLVLIPTIIYLGERATGYRQDKAENSI